MGLVQPKIEISVETSPQLIESLHMAREVALKSDVAEVLPGHLLLAMLEDDESSFLLDAYGVDFSKLRTQLSKLVQNRVKPKTLEQHAVFSPAIEQIMRHAREQAQKNALAEVDSNLILAVILSEKTGFLKKLLAPYDLDTSGVLQYLELREGKTVDIDPLPSMPSPAVKTTQNPTQEPVVTPVKAPDSTPVHNPGASPARNQTAAAGAPPIRANPTNPAGEPILASAPPAPVATPQATARPPVAGRPSPVAGPQHTNTPAPSQPSQTPMPQGDQPGAPHPAAARTQMPSKLARPPVPPTPVMPQTMKSHEAPVPIPPNNQDQATSGMANQQGLPGQSSPPPLPSSPNAATPSPQTPDTAAQSDKPPSRLRSLFGGIGKMGGSQNKNTKAPDAQSPAPLEQPDTAPITASPAPKKPVMVPTSPTMAPAASQPPVKPMTASPGLAPTPANNNQTPSLFEAPSTPQPEPERTPLPNPTHASVEQLVDPANRTPAHMPLPPQATVPLSHHNRPAKRRRAAQNSRGATGNLSATGSVLEKGRLVEAVPRKMKVNKPSRAEVRITREQLDEINAEFENLSDSHIHELAVTEAMTVQLRAPGSGFHIENLSPQTQWIDRNQRHINDADFGVWRWNVTPVKSGKSRLQLVISARTVDDEGNIHIADIPDKIIELSISGDYRKTFKKAAFIAFLVIASIAVGRYGEVAYQWLSTMVAKYR